MTSETDAEFVADMEWLHSHDREAALPPEKLARLFALARRGAADAARIEKLEAALRMFACPCADEHLCSVPDNCRNYLARAALEGK